MMKFGNFGVGLSIRKEYYVVHDKRCACGKIAVVGIRINLKALLGDLSTRATGEYIASVHG